MDSAVGGEPLNPQSDGVDSSIGEKRPVENGEGEELAVRPAKKARFGEEMKRVAEIVLVLSGMGQIRGGKSPTKAELGLMAEARAKLAEMCQEFAPEDIVGKDAVGAVIEDLGLNGKVKDQRLGLRAPKLTISEKVSLAKRKMEESKKYVAPTKSFTSHSLQPSPSPVGSATHTVRVLPSDKPGHATVSSGGFVSSSIPGHATSVSNAPSSNHFAGNGVRGPTVTATVVTGHCTNPSTVALPRADRPHLRSDRANLHIGASQTQGFSSTNHTVMNPQTWSAQPQSGVLPRSIVENKTTYQNLSNIPQMGQAARDQSFRPLMTQTAPGSIQGMNQPMQGVNFAGASPLANNNHTEIVKIVQKLLQPRMSQRPTWTPPSREYMNKALACQMCKATINDVESVLICDACEKGFHLKCLQSSNLKGIPKSEWHCPKCMQLCNGKPLPPKYGRVMRSMSTMKVPANTVGAQPPSDKKVGNPDPKPNPQTTAPNLSSGSHAPAGFGDRTVVSNSSEQVSNSDIPNLRETEEKSPSTSNTVLDQRFSTDTSTINHAKPTEAVSSSFPQSSERSNQQQTRVAGQFSQQEKHVPQSECPKTQPPALVPNAVSESDHSKPPNNTHNDETVLPNCTEVPPPNDESSAKEPGRICVEKDGDSIGKIEDNQPDKTQENADGSSGLSTVVQGQLQGQL